MEMVSFRCSKLYSYLYCSVALRKACTGKPNVCILCSKKNESSFVDLACLPGNSRKVLVPGTPPLQVWTTETLQAPPGQIPLIFLKQFREYQHDFLENRRLAVRCCRGSDKMLKFHLSRFEYLNDSFTMIDFTFQILFWYIYDTGQLQAGGNCYRLCM